MDDFLFGKTHGLDGGDNCKAYRLVTKTCAKEIGMACMDYVGLEKAVWSNVPRKEYFLSTFDESIFYG